MLSRLAALDPRLVRWKKDNVYGFLAIHAVAALALVPWFFSWTGVILLFAGLYVFGVLGINLCFHRALTHRGLACPLWLERSFAFLGVCVAYRTRLRTGLRSIVSITTMPTKNTIRTARL